MIIDMFCHHVSPTIVQRIHHARQARDSKDPGPKEFLCPVQNADPEVRLGLMDKYGVTIQALSLTTESLYGLDPDGLVINSSYSCVKPETRALLICTHPKMCS